MLEQQVLRLANDCIRLEFAEQNKRIREDISRIESEMVMRGVLQSGGTLKRITSLCAEATKDRAQLAWQTLCRFLTTSGIQYYEGLSEELKCIVAEHLPETLDDLKGYVKQEVEKLGFANLIQQLQDEVEIARITALVTIYGEIDLFVLSLKNRKNMANEKAEQATPVTQIREFGFINDPALKQCIERDYAEIQRAFIAQCWKSVIILSGGIIEAILTDLLLHNSVRAAGAVNTPKQHDSTRWDLADLIKVAVELDLVSAGVEKLSHSVREYRNLVHPGNELRNKLALHLTTSSVRCAAVDHAASPSQMGRMQRRSLGQRLT